MMRRKKQIEKDIENDPRKVSDLFVDKYGAMPMKNSPFDIVHGFEQEILGDDKLAVVELFEDDSIECLLKSIPIKELFADYDLKFRKMEIIAELKKEYQVQKLPCLLFFKQGELVGKIEGFYSTDKKEELKSEINRIMDNSKK